ncbi:MAG: hypothetical protein O3C21_16305, partial [Verrucomicrobia bacterium]|nr:hypothetical protein [Verrucomicrobiota bacterium]
MSDKLDDPAAWSKPMLIWDRSWPDCPHAIDFWIICDATHARLFFTSNNKLWRSDTPLVGFPKGFTEPKLVMETDLFEPAPLTRSKAAMKSSPSSKPRAAAAVISKPGP